MSQLSNAELNAIIGGSNDKPPAGHILYLLCNSGFVAASDSRDVLRRAGDLRVECGVSDGYSIVPLDFEMSEAYFI